MRSTWARYNQGLRSLAEIFVVFEAFDKAGSSHHFCVNELRGTQVPVHCADLLRRAILLLLIVLTLCRPSFCHHHLSSFGPNPCICNVSYESTYHRQDLIFIASIYWHNGVAIRYY